jgi:ABC-type protease/lipase transport system fused ATPase/permease subunit
VFLNFFRYYSDEILLDTLGGVQYKKLVDFENYLISPQEEEIKKEKFERSKGTKMERNMKNLKDFIENKCIKAIIVYEKRFIFFIFIFSLVVAVLAVKECVFVVMVAIICFVLVDKNFVVYAVRYLYIYFII